MVAIRSKDRAMARAAVSATTGGSAAKPTLGTLVELLLPLLVLGLLIALCIQLLLPFVGLILWTLVLAICFYPLHNVLKRRGLSNRMSASIIGTLLAALILIPTAIATISAASSVPELVSELQSGNKQVRPPPESLQSVPLVGQKAYAAWSQASADTPAFMKKFGPQLASFTKWMVAQAGGTMMAILMLVLAVIFAAITLAYA